MDNSIEENGITLGDLWRIVSKKIWLVLSVTLVAAVAAFLIVTLWANPAAGSYSLDFTLNYPGREELKYPDGTPFYYQDIISADMLERAKASSEEFANVNISRLLSEDKISIAAEMQGNGSTGKFTLKVSQSFFTSREQATAFLKAVANGPVEMVKGRGAASDYHLSESAYESAYSFRDRIELLTAQRARMITQYDRWINLFSNSFVVTDQPLKNYRADLEVIFSNTLREDLLNSLDLYGYVLPERLQERLAALREERAVNETKIRELKAVLASTGGAVSGTGQSENSDSLLYMLGTLTVRNVEIDYEMELLTEENIAAFEQIIDREYERLESAADTIQSVAAAIYEQEARVNFGSARALNEGETSVVIITVGAAVLAFLVTSAIVCAVSLSKSRASSKSAASDGKENEQ